MYQTKQKKQKLKMEQEQLQLKTNANSQDKEKLTFHNIEETPFSLYLENNCYRIVMGKYICSPKKFENLEDGINYINSKPWELIVISSVIYNEKINEIKK